MNSRDRRDGVVNVRVRLFSPFTECKSKRTITRGALPFQAEDRQRPVYSAYTKQYSTMLKTSNLPLSSSSCFEGVKLQGKKVLRTKSLRSHSFNVRSGTTVDLTDTMRLEVPFIACIERKYNLKFTTKFF